MQVAGPSQGHTEASSFVAEASLRGHPSLRQWLNPMSSAVPGAGGATPRRRAAGLRRRCQRAAEHIRHSTGTAHDARGKEGAIEDRPWPRLLLWVFACAALVVSLAIRTDGLDERDPGLAQRAAATKEVSETGLPFLSSIIQRGEAHALALKSGPRG
jgi:hypothetical protein